MKSPVLDADAEVPHSSPKMGHPVSVGAAGCGEPVRAELLPRLTDLSEREGAKPRQRLDKEMTTERGAAKCRERGEPRTKCK